MVFFPDQALKIPDPEGGSRSLARGFALGDAARRTSLAEFQSAAESERADASAARSELDARRKGTETLTKILTGVANAPDDIFPQVLRAGVETAKRLGVDTSKYEGLSADEARQQAKVDLQALQGFQAEGGPLVKAFDPNSPTGASFKTRADAKDQPVPAAKGLDITVNPDGSTNIRTNAPQGGFTKATQTKLQGDQIKAADQLARVKNIQEAFNPEFLETGTKFDAAFTAGKEKLGFSLSGGDKKFLTEFSTFKRRTIDNVNKLLNELSGAAVSPQEAIRIRNSLPDAGDGIFDGDSPTVFKAIMDDVTRDLKLSFARRAWARSQGLDPLKISLSEMDARIEARGQEIFDEISAARPDLPQDAVMFEVQNGLRKEFGDLR